VQSPLHLHDQCLCALGREIGFTDAAMAPFAPLRVVYANFATGHHRRHRRIAARDQHAGERHRAGAGVPTRRRRSSHERYTIGCMSPPGEYGLVPPALQALVVQQSPSGALQLLSRGNAVSVLDHCSHRFDGSAVRVLTQAERRSLLASDAALRRQGKGSLAFAYKPVPHDFYALLHADAPADGDDGAATARRAPRSLRWSAARCSLAWCRCRWCRASRRRLCRRCAVAACASSTCRPIARAPRWRLRASSASRPSGAL
jgi:hypothetical protein